MCVDKRCTFRVSLGMVKFRDIIDRWPSRAAFALDIGASPQSVGNMYERDSIPARYWSATVLSASARDLRGVTLRQLAEAAASKREVAV